MKAKKVVVTWMKVESYVANFICPNCRVSFQGFVQRNSVQIICQCGQLLQLEHQNEKEEIEWNA